MLHQPLWAFPVGCNPSHETNRVFSRSVPFSPYRLRIIGNPGPLSKTGNFWGSFFLHFSTYFHLNSYRCTPISWMQVFWPNDWNYSSVARHAKCWPPQPTAAIDQLNTTAMNVTECEFVRNSKRPRNYCLRSPLRFSPKTQVNSPLLLNSWLKLNKLHYLPKVVAGINPDLLIFLQAGCWLGPTELLHSGRECHFSRTQVRPWWRLFIIHNYSAFL